jgi:hypothetical protein
LLAYLTTVADPRTCAGRRHPLVAILVLAASAVLAGARSIAAIGAWLSDGDHPGQRHRQRAVAVDGKTLRGRGAQGRRQVHLGARHPPSGVVRTRPRTSASGLTEPQEGMNATLMPVDRQPGHQPT